MDDVSRHNRHVDSIDFEQQLYTYQYHYSPHCTPPLSLVLKGLYIHLDRDCSVLIPSYTPNRHG